MQHEVLFFSPHFVDDTLNTRAECVRDSLICRKYMFLAKIFALRSMGIQLVPSPLYLHAEGNNNIENETHFLLRHSYYTKVEPAELYSSENSACVHEINFL